MQNGVIIYLSRERDVGLLYHSLVLLYKNFNSEYKYPVVVFHDDIQRTTLAQLLGALNQSLGFVPNIKFEILKFELPPHISADPSLYNPPLTQFGMGYRHMCRLHSGELYKHPSLLQYDWYWRLDSDSFILSEIKHDVFDHMVEKGYEYAYVSEYEKDEEFVVSGLWDTTKKFMKENNVTPVSLANKLKQNEWALDMFYTNFEIAKFSFFRSKEYMSYYNYLDQTGNIYYRRWGDAPIHWLGVHMFLPDANIWCIKNITYQHGSWVRNISSFSSSLSTVTIPEPYRTQFVNEFTKSLNFTIDT
jgi:hypothetical protein